MGIPQTDSPPGDLRVETFAREVGLAEKTVRNGIASDRIPHYKVGTGAVRIPRSYLDELRANAYGDYDEQIKRLVDAAPKLTEAQRDKLAVLLNPATKDRRRAAGTH